jgi:hypothetical protein
VADDTQSSAIVAIDLLATTSITIIKCRNAESEPDGGCENRRQFRFELDEMKSNELRVETLMNKEQKKKKRWADCTIGLASGDRPSRFDSYQTQKNLQTKDDE